MQDNKKKKRRIITWRTWHKWLSIVFTFFILMFCFSGIILNHRQFFSTCEVSRWWMPSVYHIDNWNQGVVKGTLKVDDGIIVFGQTGVWKTDTKFESWEDFNNGITQGIDNRKISNVVRTSDGILWCAPPASTIAASYASHSALRSSALPLRICTFSLLMSICLKKLFHINEW